MKLEKNGVYLEFLHEIKSRINDAQTRALKAVNRELVLLYWEMGKRVVEKQRQEQWGDGVIESLARDLQSDFPGIKGFSARNIWQMRDLYLSYADNEKLQTLSAELGWSHNVAILGKCKDNLEREFYMRMTQKHAWSYRVLLNNIENQSYEKTLLGQTNFEATLPVTVRDKATLVVKDEYTFDFLELVDDYSERQLENAMILKINDFLR